MMRLNGCSEVQLGEKGQDRFPSRHQGQDRSPEWKVFSLSAAERAKFGSGREDLFYKELPTWLAHK